MTPEHLAIVERLRLIAAGIGITMSHLALAWVLRRPEVASALTGASRLEQIDENVQAAGINLSDDMLTAIDSVLAGK